MGFSPNAGRSGRTCSVPREKELLNGGGKKARENGIADSTSCPVENMTETSSLVGNAFQQLPEEQRALLWLREVEGQSYQELASILEVPVGTIRSRLFAAREELRKVWSATAKVTEESI